MGRDRLFPPDLRGRVEDHKELSFCLGVGGIAGAGGVLLLFWRSRILGIEIWHQLNQQQEEVRILPFCYFYEHLFQRCGPQAPVRAKAQRGRPEAEQRFLDFFRGDTATEMRELLKQKYLPQEGLHYLWLKERGEEGGS